MSLNSFSICNNWSTSATQLAMWFSTYKFKVLLDYFVLARLLPVNQVKHLKLSVQLGLHFHPLGIDSSDFLHDFDEALTIT